MASARLGSGARSAEVRRRLWAFADSEELNVKEWWMVDLVCRQGLEVAAAGRSLGVGAPEARSLWRDLEVLAAGPR